MLTKPVINASACILAHSFKPAYLRDGTSPHIVFVTQQGIEHDIAATGRVWAQAKGKPMPGKRHSAYDVRTTDNFLVCLKDGTARNIQGATAIAVHCFPKNDFLPTTKPVKLVGVETISGKIDQDTGEVTITQTPLRVKDAHIIELLNQINSLASLSPGQMLVPSISAQVESVSFNNFIIKVSMSDEAQVTTLGETMKESLPEGTAV